MNGRIGWMTVVLLAACNGGGDDTDLDPGTDSEPVMTGVSGTAVGLFNGPAVVSVNGTDISVEGDGAFSLDDAVEVGTAYEVTLTSAPEGQSCDIIDGSGTATEDGVAVALDCHCNVNEELVGTEAPGNVTIGTRGQVSYGAVSEELRGINTPAFRMACGGVVTELIDGTQPVPGLEGTAMEGAVTDYAWAIEWSGETAWTYAELYTEEDDAESVFQFRPPTFTPELVALEGALIEGRTVDGLIGLDATEDGVGTLTLVGFDDDGYYPMILSVSGEGTDVVFDGAVGVVNGEETSMVCSMGSAVRSLAGYTVAPVNYGPSCMTRGIRDAYSALLVIPDGGTPRLELLVDSAFGDSQVVQSVGLPQVTDAGEAIVPIALCELGGFCNFQQDNLVRVALDDGTVTPVLLASDTVGDDFVVQGFAGFDIGEDGAIAVSAQIQQVCRRGIPCYAGAAFLHHDEDWQIVLRQGDIIGDYEVTGSGGDVHAYNGGAGALLRLVDTETSSQHYALACWDGTEVSFAAGESSPVDLGDDVYSVWVSGMNPMGQFVASAEIDADRYLGLITGSCQ